MTFDQIVSRVKSRLNLTSSDATTRIGEEVNDRHRAITASINVETVKRATISQAITIGSPVVTFTNTEKIINIVDRSTTPYRVLAEVTPEFLRNRQPYVNSFAQYYVILNYTASTVVVECDSTFSAALTLFADVWQNLATLSGAQTPLVPESFHDILVTGALADELFKMGKKQDALAKEAIYNDRLGDLRLFLSMSSYKDVVQGGMRDSMQTPSGVPGAGGGSSSAAVAVTNLFGAANKAVLLDAGGIGQSALITEPYVTPGTLTNTSIKATAAIAYSKLNLAASIVNADVAAGAAIAYSKLNLATSIVNADVAGAAAIAYSKLNLATSIVNADVAAAAAVVLTKLANGSALSVVGNATNGAAAHTDIAAATDGQILRRTGTALAFGSAVKLITNTETGTLNNWAPTGTVAGDTYIEWSGASDATVTGFNVGQYAGLTLTLKNTGTKVMYFVHQSGSSSAGNKLFNVITTQNTPIAPGGSAIFVYDGTNFILTRHEQAGWIAYTPVWGNTGTGNTLGNGTITGAYCIRGNEVEFWVNLTWGTTTSAGNGVYTFTYPFTVETTDTPNMVFAAYLLDNSVGAEAGISKYLSTTTFVVYNAGSLNGGCSATVPFTWATSDSMQTRGTSKVA